MAEFDITVDKDEHNQFLQQERPYWPMVPTQCTVPVCRIFGPFSSFKDFQEHWSKKHTEVSSFYKCQSCGKKFSNNKHAKAHTKSKIHKGQSITIKYMELKNEEFINPQDSLPYQLGSKEKREEMRTIQRYSASQKRKADLAVKENDFSKIPYYGDGIYRDERVVERNGQLYRDTNLWDKLSKRIKLHSVENH